MDLKSALRAFFKYDLESALQIKDVFGLKKTTWFSAASVLVVTKTTRTFQIGFEKWLQAFFKYDLESASQVKDVFDLKKNKNVFRRVGFSCDKKHAFPKWI